MRHPDVEPGTWSSELETRTSELGTGASELRNWGFRVQIWVVVDAIGQTKAVAFKLESEQTPQTGSGQLRRKHALHRRQDARAWGCGLLVDLSGRCVLWVVFLQTGNKLGDAGASEIAPAVEKLMALTKLDLAENGVKVEGVYLSLSFTTHVCFSLAYTQSDAHKWLKTALPSRVFFCVSLSYTYTQAGSG
eukprot:2560225-Rhodomonas_salina.1